MKPLIDEEQYKKTTLIVEQFFSEQGEAKVLQEQLEIWSQEKGKHWTTCLWDHFYLTHRDVLPLTSNFNVLLNNDPFKESQSVMELVSKISWLMTELYHKIIDGEISPEKINGQPLDMSQYKSFFRSVRIPQKEKDLFYVGNFEKEKNYVVLLYKNNVLKVPVTNEQGIFYNWKDIMKSLKVATKSIKEAGVNVGVFTAAKRNQAAKIYSELQQSDMNSLIIDTIADAIAIISIDEESTTAESAIENLLLSSENKYFDKTIQVVITKDYHIGFNVEHTMVDGSSFSAVIEHIYNGLTKKKIETIDHSDTPTIVHQEWELNEQLVRDLKRIEKAYQARTNTYSLLTQNFAHFGSEEIKKLNISPDAFFHSALQLAQYRTCGTFKSVYEAVSIRTFQEGRIECARATSVEKNRVVEAIEAGEDVRTVYRLLQQAGEAHVARIRECQNGLGIEKYLYGLKQMYYLFKEELGLDEIPTIFQDVGYKTLRYDFISTSGITYDDVVYRMYGPLEEDGHGLAYIMKEDMITLNLSSFTHNKAEGEQLMTHIITALDELRSIAEKALK